MWCSLGRRRGLQSWVISSLSGRSSSWKVPPSLANQNPLLSIGVQSLVAYSPHDQELSLISLTALDHDWKRLPVLCDAGGSILEVQSGCSHTVALLNNGKVWSCGSNYFGQSGRSSDGALISGLVGPVKQVVCGLDHTLYLLENGKVLSSGWASDGQTVFMLGDGSYDNTHQLNEVQLDTGSAVRKIASCSDSSLAFTEAGEVLVWGNNEYGQLGVPSEEPQIAQPTLVETCHMDGVVTGVVAGGPFTAFLTSAGSVYVAGYNNMTSELDSLSSQQRLDGRFRLVHCGKMKGKVTRLEAGLNYLVGLTSASAGFIWGKLQTSEDSSGVMFHWPSEFVVCSGVHHLAYGPLGLAALTDSPHSKILEIT